MPVGATDGQLDALSSERISGVLDLPLSAAAERLGVRRTVLKKAYRRRCPGLPWPGTPGVGKPQIFPDARHAQGTSASGVTHHQLLLQLLGNRPLPSHREKQRQAERMSLPVAIEECAAPRCATSLSRARSLSLSRARLRALTHGRVACSEVDAAPWVAVRCEAAHSEGNETNRRGDSDSDGESEDDAMDMSIDGENGVPSFLTETDDRETERQREKESKAAFYGSRSVEPRGEPQEIPWSGPQRERREREDRKPSRRCQRY